MAATRRVLCDVFAEAPFTGNPLAVVVDGDKVPASLMQAITHELNLFETVFVCAARAGGEARLRIFTPRRKLPFAGHPTLESAAVIARNRRCTTLMLETGVGAIRTSIDEPPDGRRQLVWMEQPLPQFSAYERTDELLVDLYRKQRLIES